MYEYVFYCFNLELVASTTPKYSQTTSTDGAKSCGKLHCIACLIFMAEKYVCNIYSTYHAVYTYVRTCSLLVNINWSAFWRAFVNPVMS